MDKIVLIVNGPSLIKEVSINTVLIHNLGPAANANQLNSQANGSSPVRNPGALDPEIKEPKSGKIKKLSDLAKEYEAIKKEKDKLKEPERVS
jgi:hypothetical protein